MKENIPHIKYIEPRDALIEDISLWPIARLYSDRPKLVKMLTEEGIKPYANRSNHELYELLSRVIYLESKRLKETPWKVDTRSEPKFWKKMKNDLQNSQRADIDENSQRKERLVILNTIVHRYAEEITGNLKIDTVRFARKFLKFFFKKMLNTAKGWRDENYGLHDRIRLYGDVDKVRNLFNEGVVILIPTHFSNMDSIALAYSMDMIAGIPSFSYGAGLNLYNNEIVGYFMKRLGTYRIDRRKKNKIYIEVLKSFSRLSILEGTNTLFFPGGTRSRSGKIETSVKLGLLHSLVEAQRQFIERGSKQKIFIVPVVIGYNVVLEARDLIHQYLSRKGEERYLDSKEQNLKPGQVVKFASNYLRTDSELCLSLGPVYDVLGNQVSDNGSSIDKWNREIRLHDYFSLNGQINTNRQREMVYTKRLGNKLVESFHKNNVVLSSHLVAHVAFFVIKKKFPAKDIFEFFNQPVNDPNIPEQEFKKVITKFLNLLHKMEQNGDILLESSLHGTMDEMIEKGIRLLGSFHNSKVLYYDENRKVYRTDDLKLLFYYSNRLSSYSLAEQIELTQKSELV